MRHSVHCCIRYWRSYCKLMTRTANLTLLWSKNTPKLVHKTNFNPRTENSCGLYIHSGKEWPVLHTPVLRENNIAKRMFRQLEFGDCTSIADSICCYYLPKSVNDRSSSALHVARRQRVVPWSSKCPSLTTEKTGDCSCDQDPPAPLTALRYGAIKFTDANPTENGTQVT